ncbi:ABC transporter ATP-binding protein [Ensifer adhaerens]|uniref:ABC transporter ATP-binding protein n=1 Tax=Ensifer adhaerens TaxID=106592 RepID=UPI001CBF91C3|nr:ABC transporter ATP-binding protein [Ensifer adhaerens]MBZ7926511.1 ABC transporter ATP-binding protein [Ensifer adhaerens]UAX97147.1 ABC transporter ATP-binding protein [Ensifer adhaerens]
MNTVTLERGHLHEVPPPLPLTETMVAFERVQKSYDGRTLVVEELNLDVRRREFLTMLGPSGSGKTTTLMMLGGFEQPTSGRILLEGQAVERLPPERRDIGFVFQNYALFPHMTVAENVGFPLRYRGIRGAEAKLRIDEALSTVKLGGLGERRPSQLSGGQQQRVALARAMVFKPKLILMDEPLGALDKQLREHMQVEIRRIQQRLGITMVYVTHDQSEALTMSDRIAVFHEGRIQQLSDPVTLYDQPANRFVAGFIGDNNTFPCEFAGTQNGFTVVRMADGTRLLTTGSSGKPGSNLTVSVRPERLILDDPGHKRCENQIAARVLERTFLGDRVRLTVEAFGSERLIASVPAAEGAPILPDSRIALACFAADCRTLTR